MTELVTFGVAFEQLKDEVEGAVGTDDAGAQEMKMGG